MRSHISPHYEMRTFSFRTSLGTPRLKVTRFIQMTTQNGCLDTRNHLTDLLAIRHLTREARIDVGSEKLPPVHGSRACCCLLAPVRLLVFLSGAIAL
jgi:hypothetical protein